MHLKYETQENKAFDEQYPIFRMIYIIIERILLSGSCNIYNAGTQTHDIDMRRGMNDEQMEQGFGKSFRM